MNNSKTNHISVSFDAISENEAFARMTVALFMAELNPTISQIDDVKTAVSEAVTNAIIHGYESEGRECNEAGGNEDSGNKKNKQENEIPQVHMACSYTDNCLIVEVSDDGVGIKDIQKAMEPLYTSKPQLERSGMGFSFMEAFMDELSVTSHPGQGTCVRMKKML
ncbi:ATP-binding protein [Agathobacter sp.]